jgi:hypothetical protein
LSFDGLNATQGREGEVYEFSTQNIHFPKEKKNKILVLKL